MQKRIDRFFITLNQTDTVAYYLALCILTFLVLFAKKSLVEDETVAFQILQEEGRFGVFSILKTLQFLAIPIIYLYKATVIGFILWVGSFMFGYKISYSQMWKIAIIAETVFLFPEIIKILWFVIGSREVTILEIKAFYPLSIMNFFNYETISPNLHYPLKALNVFEILFWLVLIELVHVTANKQRNYAAAIVCSSYVLMFLIWLVYYSLIYK